MDRRHRHRAVLSVTVAVAGLTLLPLAASPGAQAPATATPTQTTPAPAVLPPAPATATPWVQASPPPTAPPAKPPSVLLRVDREGRYFFDREKDASPANELTERLRKLREAQGDNLHVVIRGGPDPNDAAIATALARAHDAGIKHLLVSPPLDTRPSVPDVTPSPAPSASPSKEDVAKAMARKREEELAKSPTASTVPPKLPPRAEPPLSPDEREAYERNLGLWLAMPPEERQAIRGQATERIYEETEKAYESSGLNLNDDQREVFALRYRQERRRLERELQDKAKAERARRLPEIMERLKREFPASSPAAVNTPKPTPKPTSTPTAAPATVATSPAVQK